MFTFEGTLKLVSKGRPFTDRTTGEVTPAKFTNYFQIQDDDGNSKVLELRGKEDYTDLIDELVVGTVELYDMQSGSGKYVSLTSLVPARSK